MTVDKPSEDMWKDIKIMMNVETYIADAKASIQHDITGDILA